MRRPRMSTRSWMLLVAILAVVLAAAVWQQRTMAWERYCRDKVRTSASGSEPESTDPLIFTSRGGRLTERKIVTRGELAAGVLGRLGNYHM